jgi:hypothetical protein
MSMRQAVVRVMAVIAARTFNHEGHEGRRRKILSRRLHEFPPPSTGSGQAFRTERERVGHPVGFLIQAPGMAVIPSEARDLGFCLRQLQRRRWQKPRSLASLGMTLVMEVGMTGGNGMTDGTG